MDTLFQEMKSKGLVSVERQPLFEKSAEINPYQLSYWKFLDNKFAQVTKMRLQRAILPCQINKYSRN